MCYVKPILKIDMILNYKRGAKMSEHECIIGLLHDSYLNEITLSDLKRHILTRKEMNEYIIETYRCKKHPMIVPEWGLKDYADRRKSTNLTRFEFCPYCGKKIDWKKIKNEEKE